MRILFIGDVFGNGGKRVCAHLLPVLKNELNPDFILVNGENLAGGRGFTVNLVKKLFKYGVDVVTGGNHTWDNKEYLYYLDQEERLLRPMNYPDGNPGRDFGVYSLSSGKSVGVINLIGRVFLYDTLDPFRMGLVEAERLKQQNVDVIIVDFHAEATSEKKALGYYLDGKVSAVIGTHTHVATADEMILPKGTGYITDAGLTGPRGSVIGIKTELVIKKYLLQTPVRFEPSEEDLWLNAVFLEIDDLTGRCLSIERIQRRLKTSENNT